VIYLGVLVVREVVRHVQLHRTANRAAELLPLLRRLRASQEVRGHPVRRPPESVGAALEPVRAALGDDADRAGAGLAGLRLEAVRDDLQLLDDVEREAVAAAELAVERPD